MKGLGVVGGVLVLALAFGGAVPADVLPGVEEDVDVLIPAERRARPAVPLLAAVPAAATPATAVDSLLATGPRPPPSV